MSKTRFVVLGDPHICDRDNDLWEEAITDINALKPDAILIVGDLTGYGAHIGTPSAVKRSIELLNKFDAPWHSVLGNHDLEARMFDTDADAVDATLKLLQRDTPWFKKDIGSLRIIGLSNTQFRDNGAYPHEVYFGPEQLDWFRNTLEDQPDKPVFVLAHVPPIASGLMVMAELHGSIGGNAYANQNHIPGDIMRIIHEHPNILFWCSGHNHLGQHYRDAISIRLGVHFIHTGVIGRHTRDQFRHSRILDIGDDSIDILTFDHEQRKQDPSLAFHQPIPIKELLAFRHSILDSRAVSVNPETMAQILTR